jgi:hypothetical protein
VKKGFEKEGWKYDWKEKAFAKEEVFITSGGAKA